MKALIITSDKFPNGNAGAVRQECIANMLIDIGYEVELIGMGEYTNKDYKFLNNIKFLSLRNKSNNLFARISGRFLFSNRVIKIIKNKSYDLILISSVPHHLINFLKKYKLANNCILIHDSVEWYSSCEFKLGKLNPSYITKNLMNTKWIDKNFRVIAISKYLENYYKKKKILCIRIPFILDTKVEKISIEENKNHKIILVYAGMIGKKDHLKNFFEAVNMLNENDKKRIEINFFGCNLKYLKKTGNINNKLIKQLNNILLVHGRVDREKIKEIISSANFTILFRNPNERYAKAGFPTKVVESLTYSTPIICNISSDLNMYLKDGYNSIICKDESILEILNSLKRILKFDKNQLRQLKINSRKSSISNFDYRDYIEILKGLIKEGKE